MRLYSNGLRGRGYHHRRDGRRFKMRYGHYEGSRIVLRRRFRSRDRFRLRPRRQHFDFANHAVFQQLVAIDNYMIRRHAWPMTEAEDAAQLRRDRHARRLPTDRRNRNYVPIAGSRR
jgi:hypothetical protein